MPAADSRQSEVRRILCSGNSESQCELDYGDDLWLVENIENPLTQQVRYLDKLLEEQVKDLLSRCHCLLDCFVTNSVVYLSRDVEYPCMQITERYIHSMIVARGQGFVFTTKFFTSLADDVSVVTSALSRLVQKKIIRRLAHGLYDLPVIHPKLGPIMPTIEQVLDAIKAADAIEVQPTGAYAANLLGLSTQIPMKIELYTSGPKKKIMFGRQEILLKPTTPKNMIGAGTKAGLILHALRQIGKDNVTAEMIEHIKSQLQEGDIAPIKKQLPYAPAWIAKIFRILINDE